MLVDVFVSAPAFHLVSGGVDIITYLLLLLLYYSDSVFSVQLIHCLIIIIILAMKIRNNTRIN